MYYHHPRPLQLLTMRPITHKYYVWRASFGNLIFSIYLITVSLWYFLIRFSWEISENILFSTGGRSTIFKGTVHVNSIDPLFKEGQADSQRKPLNLFLKKNKEENCQNQTLFQIKKRRYLPCCCTDTEYRCESDMQLFKCWFTKTIVNCNFDSIWWSIYN